MSVRAAAFVAGLAALAALPFAARALRRDGAELCALDGVAIAAGRRVRIDDAGASRAFCCVDCAALWASTAAGARDIVVTDETSGAELPAASAYLVRSRVASCEATGCCIHVFAKESDARAHAAAFGGTVLSGDDRPFGAVR